MDLNIGKKLDGRYEITELIGIGGMADVYKAVDVMENRVVAVKILKTEFSENQEFLRRFRNESKAIAVLSHPNIVRIYDVGFTDEIQFIVMEYIDGITLKEFMEQQGVLRWKDALHFLTQILRALQHAHDRGIVHRDIKPQNIMLFPDGTIKVMDFGIARFSRVDGKTLSDKTIGSVHYISPEQARGDFTDERSDIYSVGAMLYEMLTGRKMFDGDNPVSIALMHMQEEPTYPRDIVPSIPEALEEIVIHAVEKDPSRRYQSAAEMIKDIDTFKLDQSVVFCYINKNNAADMNDTTKYFNPITAPEAEYDDYDDEEDEPEEEIVQQRSYVIPILSAVTVAIVAIAVIFIALTINNSNKNKNKLNEVPNMIGSSFNDIEKEYKDKFNLKRIDEYNSEFGKDIIFEQDVQSGRNMPNGSTITVKVSKGAREVSIPDVIGLEYSDAIKTKFNAVGLDVIVKEEYNDDVLKGFVIKTDPSGVANEGTKVTVFVSKGAVSDIVTVPSVIGMTKDEAIAELAKSKFTNYEIKDVNVEEDAGKVIAQKPAPNDFVSKNTTITISISTGQLVDEKVKVKIPIPAGLEGSFTLNFFRNGSSIGNHYIERADTVAGTEIEAEISGKGEGSITVEAVNNATKLSDIIAVYKVNFVKKTFERESFVPEKFLALIQTTTTEPPVTEPPMTEPVESDNTDNITSSNENENHNPGPQHNN